MGMGSGRTSDVTNERVTAQPKGEEATERERARGAAEQKTSGVARHRTTPPTPPASEQPLTLTLALTRTNARECIGERESEPPAGRGAEASERAEQ